MRRCAISKRQVEVDIWKWIIARKYVDPNIILVEQRDVNKVLASPPGPPYWSVRPSICRFFAEDL